MKKKSLKMAWAAFMLSVVASHIVETYASEGLLDPFPELTLKFTNTEPLTLRQHRKSQVDPSLPHPNNVDSPTSPEQPLNKNVSTAKSVDSESDEESSGDAVATFFKNFAEKIGVSLTIFYRKLKELAGWNGNDEMRTNSTTTLRPKAVKGNSAATELTTSEPSTPHNPNHRTHIAETFERLRMQIESFSKLGSDGRF